MTARLHIVPAVIVLSSLSLSAQAATDFDTCAYDAVKNLTSSASREHLNMITTLCVARTEQPLSDAEAGKINMATLYGSIMNGPEMGLIIQIENKSTYDLTEFTALVKDRTTGGTKSFSRNLWMTYERGAFRVTDPGPLINFRFVKAGTSGEYIFPIQPGLSLSADAFFAKYEVTYSDPKGIPHK